VARIFPLALAGLGALLLLPRKKVAVAAQYDLHFRTYSEHPTWAKAVAKVESDFNPNVRGTAGEYGLMQIKEESARDVGFIGYPAQLFDPGVNIKYGSAYLDWMFEMFGPEVGVQAYNVGPGAARRGTRNPIYFQKVVEARRTVSVGLGGYGVFF